jgi:hypothetical protein
MALKNFLKEGSYLTFERIEYSKINKTLICSVIVYEDETKQNVLLRYSENIEGINESIDVKDIIYTEDELMDVAPEYIGLKEGEGIFIKIKDPISEYTQQVTNKVIMRQPSGKIIFHTPIYIYNLKTKETYERQLDDTFEVIDDYDIKTNRQFDLKIDSSNPIKSFYEVIKRKPIFKDCIDA